MNSSSVASNPQLRYLSEVQANDLSIVEMTAELRHAFLVGMWDGERKSNDKVADREDYCQDLLSAYVAGKWAGWYGKNPGKVPPKNVKMSYS